MKRYLGLAFLVVLAAGAALVPVGAPPATGQAPGINPPAVAICPVVEGQGRSTAVNILSQVEGNGRFTAFAGGAALGSESFDLTSGGSARIPVIDVSAVGVIGGLAEVPSPASAASSSIVGSESSAAESCAATPSRETLLAGGSTLSGEELELQLMNPYAGDATVSISVFSESGVETNETLDRVSVPSRSSTRIDFDEIFPGRARLSVLVETTEGSVIPVGRMESGADSALWNAIEPGQEWFVVAPGETGRREVTLATSSPADVSYEIDMYGPEGLVEGFDEGVVPGRGTVTIDVASIAEAPVAFRIFASAPVAPFFRIEPDTGMALTTGKPGASTSWLLPGAGSVPNARTRIFVLNPGTEDGTVTITGGDGDLAFTEEIVISPGGVAVYQLPEGRVDGVFVDSDVPVVAVWTMRSDPTLAMSAGFPLTDG